MRISAFLENIGQAARDAGVPMQSFLAQLKQEGLESVYAGYPTSLKPMRQMVLGLLKAFGLPMEGVWGPVDFLSMTDEEATEELVLMGLRHRGGLDLGRLGVFMHRGLDMNLFEGLAGFRVESGFLVPDDEGLMTADAVAGVLLGRLCSRQSY